MTKEERDNIYKNICPRFVGDIDLDNVKFAVKDVNVVIQADIAYQLTRIADRLEAVTSKDGADFLHVQNRLGGSE